MKIENYLEKYIFLIFLLCVAPWSIADATSDELNLSTREKLRQIGLDRLPKIANSPSGKKEHQIIAQALLNHFYLLNTDEHLEPESNLAQKSKIRPRDSVEEIHSTISSNSANNIEKLNQLAREALPRIFFNSSFQQDYRKKALRLFKDYLQQHSIALDHNPKSAEQALFQAIEENDPISIEALRLLNITFVSPESRKRVENQLEQAFENGNLKQIQLLMQAGVSLSASSTYTPTLFNLLETGIEAQNNIAEYLENTYLLASSDLNDLEQELSRACTDLDIEHIKQVMQNGATISYTSPCFKQAMALLKLGMQHQQTSDSISSHPISIEDLIDVNDEETELLSQACEHKEISSDCIHVNDKMPPQKNWITRLKSIVGKFLFNWQGAKHNQKTKVK